MFKIIGALGLILVSTGLLVSSRRKRNILSFFGGVCLLVYSFFLNDIVFILLQSVYILFTVIDYARSK